MIGFDPNSENSKKCATSNHLERINSRKNRTVHEINDNESVSESSKKNKRKRRKSTDANVPDCNLVLSDSEASKNITNNTLNSSQPKQKKTKSTNGVNESKEIEIQSKESDTITLKVRQDLLSEKTECSTPHSIPEENKSNKTKLARKKKQKLRKNVDFMKLGEHKIVKQAKVHRTLPYWLQCPRAVGQDLSNDSCPLSSLSCVREDLLQVLREEGITNFFPVQRAVIPEILAQANCSQSYGRSSDVCVSAATGSGKTLAYVLPVLQVVASMAAITRVRALVILPTEQLAVQITRVFKRYGSCVGVRVGSAVGSTSFQQEQRELVAPLEDWEQDLVGYGARGLTGEVGVTHKSLVHVVVATPDRLKDHMMLTPGFDLTHLRYLIFDEADRLVSGDGGQWINSIVKTIQTKQCATENITNVLAGLPIAGNTAPPQHLAHKLLISATLSCDPEKLEALNLFDPILFTTPAADPAAAHHGAKPATANNDSAENNSVLGMIRPATLKEQFVIVEQDVQPLVLHHLVIKNQWKKVLVFTNTREASHRLAILLQTLANDEYKVGEFSSKLGRRQKKMADNFSKGYINVLVCTDSLSRGVDFEDIEVVVNYDTTQCSQTYVHRVGRTARAGKQGLALTMLLPFMSKYKFKSMLTKSGSGVVEQMKVNTNELHPMEKQYKEALEFLRGEVASSSGKTARATQKLAVGMPKRDGNKKQHNVSAVIDIE